MIDVEDVARIAPETSGKYRYVVSQRARRRSTAMRDACVTLL